MPLQILAHFLRNVLAPEIHDVGNIFHQQGEWLQLTYVMHVPQIEVAARVIQESVGIVVDLTEFGPQVGMQRLVDVARAVGSAAADIRIQRLAGPSACLH